MSPAFIKGVTEQFPEAEITFDKFHVMKLVGEAVDTVRRQEQKDRPELKGTRYLWLRNPETLRANSAAQLATLRAANLKTARAYAIKETLKAFWDQPVEEAEAFLRRWYFWATHSRLEPIRNFIFPTSARPLGPSLVSSPLGPWVLAILWRWDT